jgi:opacity protein-like surface antigen
MTMPVAARGTHVLLAALLALTAAPLAAQVGHAPDQSPFRDLTTRQTFTVSAGYFAGNEANAGVGWRRAALIGGRLDTRLGGPIDLYVSVGVAGSSRYKINTSLDSATRKTGPLSRTLVLADLGFILNLTGAKTWHGLAPYVGFGAGEVLPTKTETDVGGYNAGTNFSLIPILGTRIFVTRTLAARVEVRDYFFRYEWPLRYFDPLDNNSNPITPPILQLGTRDKQWTHNFTLTVGLAYGFNF